MSLTWRDAVSTLALVVVLVAYAAHLQGMGLWLVSSTWATSAVILVVGLIGGCAVRAKDELSTRPQPLWTAVYRSIAAVLGVIALIAGGIGLISESAYALEILVMTTITLWGAATLRHVFTLPPEQ
jgi:hypothetical protein